jgi:hypothetical protein
MFQVFELDVVKVYLRCCIFCTDNILMLQPYVFKCFRRMFQVFHLDVAKMDLGVAYICMLQAYVSSVSDVSG